MSDDLVEFNQEPDCPKCGREDLSLSYRPGANAHWGKRDVYPCGTREEHIEIKCNDCGYLYGMKPKTPRSITQVLPEGEKTL